MKQIRQLTSLFVLISFLANAQTEEVRPFTQMVYQPVLHAKTEAIGDTITLPIADDFSQPSPLPNTRFWADNKAFVNSTIAQNLFSIGAVTLDGTDQYGFPYNINSNTSDTFSDVLTSRYIKFNTPPNNVFLSFYYQAAGLGDVPEPDDSLVVEFYVPQDSIWEQVWAVKGVNASTPFRAAIIPVDSAKYLQDGFRFRFGNYGAPNGSFDIWNIDYVELDENRNPADTIIKEPAFVRNHPYLTENFTHIPWFHYTDGLLENELTFTYRRNGPPPSGGWALNLGKYNLAKDGNSIKDRLTVPVVTNLNHNVDIDFQVPLQPVSASPITDEFTLDMKTWFDGTAEGLRQNDTVSISIPFKNYYALDDGSAEHGYGIKNQSNARMAFQFTPITPDTLKGLFINFAHVGVDATTNTFRIAIWKDNNGEPGLIQYLSDSLYTPEYAYYHNGFMPFELDEGVFISGTVFIGLVQTLATPIHVGLDYNTSSMIKYYGHGFNWNESLVHGAWLIRPYFKYTPRDFSVAENPMNEINVFPNPATATLQIDAQNAVNWVLINTLGQTVKSGKTKNIAVTDLPRGMYVLHVQSTQLSTTHKIILR